MNKGIKENEKEDLLANIDKQLLLKLLDSLIIEQDIIPTVSQKE